MGLVCRAVDPDAGGGGFDEMDGLAGGAEGECFVVAALKDIELVGRKKMEIVEELQEALVLFIDTQNDSGIAGAEFGEQNAAVFAKRRNGSPVKLRICFRLIGSEPAGERQDPGFDLLQNSLISSRVLAVRIFDFPFLDVGKAAKDAVVRYARHIDDEIGFVE